MNPIDDAVKNNHFSHKRKLLLTLVTLVVLVMIVLSGLYVLLIGRFYEDTDNAYVNGNVIPITSQIAGTIIGIEADDTQFVKTGQVLVKLDPTDSYIAFEQAKANLAQTIRTTQQLFINNNGLKASILDKEATQEKARLDVSRRNEAIGIGAVSQEELTHAQNTLKSANASITEARAALLANQALTEHTDLSQHPSVLAAAAMLRKAYIDYKRTTIQAPVSGEISKRTAQIGRRIEVGTQLMALVPLDEVWIDANFKEKQLRNMRIGQEAIIYADLYGSSVKYHGKIVGFSAGTGSAFALLPAQNATGNWIKVVQRLPVRIAFEATELKAHPLRIGLSMQITVDTHDRSGALIKTPAPASIYNTRVYDDLNKEADEEIARIIAKNVKNIAHLNLNATSAKNKTEFTKRIG